MSKGRVESFTDAVIAIIITVLVLGLHEPASSNFGDLFEEWHRLGIYIVSFLMLAIYWINHHYLFGSIRVVDGKVLWANNFFLLSLTFFPFVTSWLGDYFFDLSPQLCFGVVIMAADILFFVVAYVLEKANNLGKVSIFLGKYWKSWVSLGANILAIALGILVSPLFIFGLNALMLILWIMPENRIAKLIQQHQQHR
ncbi:MAG: TMEM175 family protein [Coriobacteriales bacterium]|nr:TMEM175 family protein [Coriobacteriales bacterium]